MGSRFVRSERVDNIKWYDVKGFEDYLQVTKNGRVRTKPRWLEYKRCGKKRRRYYEGKELIHKINQHGYYRVGFRINRKYHNMVVHRILGLTFIENPNDKPVINHIDGDKTNNNLENLEWCTVRENVNHARDNELLPTSKVDNATAQLIKELYKSGKYTQRDLAKMYDTQHSNIWHIIHKR